MGEVEPPRRRLRERLPTVETELVRRIKCSVQSVHIWWASRLSAVGGRLQREFGGAGLASYFDIKIFFAGFTRYRAIKIICTIHIRLTKPVHSILTVRASQQYRPVFQINKFAHLQHLFQRRKRTILN